MASINLRTILCHLIDDDSFLSTIIESDTNEIEKKQRKKKGFHISNMTTEYYQLLPHEIQKYNKFPHKFKKYLLPEHIRFGIKNTVEKNLSVINISFLNSFNILLRPELFKCSIEEHLKNISLFENFLCHTIRRNYNIDKIKNTRKIQEFNKNLANDLINGKISHVLIQKIIDIFEINLLVFDLSKTEITLYWTHGTKYPYFNTFRDLFCMSYVQGNYEPILMENSVLSDQQKNKLYGTVLANIDEIKTVSDIKLDTHSLLDIVNWDIDADTFLKICKRFYDEQYDESKTVNAIKKLS